MSRRLCVIGPAGNTHVQRWAQALTERGWSVSLIATQPLTAPLPAPLDDLPRYTIPTAVAGMSAAQRAATLLRGWARVPGLLAALRPDLVHVHSLPTPAAVPFLQRVPRLVVSAWGSDVAQRDRRKAQWYPRLLSHAAAVTATSRYLAEVTAAYLAFPRAIEIVPFGVDLARFIPAVEPPRDVRIGTLRHLERIYGIDVFLDALALLDMSNNQYRVAIGGAGSQRQALEHQALRLGLTARIAFQGRIPHAQVPAFLHALQIFVMPSRAEAFGVAALEAQACGVPVVATNVGGLPEVVRAGETGLLVPPEQPQALAAALAALLNDPQRRATMGQAGREFVREWYDWQSSVNRMLKVYDQAYAQIKV